MTFTKSEIYNLFTKNLAEVLHRTPEDVEFVRYGRSQMSWDTFRKGMLNPEFSNTMNVDFGDIDVVGPDWIMWAEFDDDYDSWGWRCVYFPEREEKLWIDNLDPTVFYWNKMKDIVGQR